MNRSPLRATIARIPCDSPRPLTTAPAEATCCTNGTDARASGSGPGTSDEVGGGGDGLVGSTDAGASPWRSATGITPAAGSVQSGGAAARAGDQASVAMTIKGRIETSV